MYEKKLEEGQVSTLNFQNESKFDPDVNLSYIDDRVQSLLGHLLKDFEGGACKEDLGAKYGGYGSFLPVYEHSPPSVSSCSWKPHAVQNNNMLRHQNNMSPTKLCQDTTLKTSRKRDSRNPALLPVANASSLRTSSKEDVCLSSMQGTGGFTAECVAIDRLNNRPEKKSGKVQKERGGISMLPRNNVQIYRELGLDSPLSSSSDISPRSEEAPDESPTTIPVDMQSSPGLGKCSLPVTSDTLSGKELISEESLITILETMTSSPIRGESFLSPLSDSLLCLMEKTRGEVCGLNTAALSPEGNWISMAFTDANKIGKWKANSEEKIRGDRRENPHRDLQSERRTDESITAGNRSTASGGRSTKPLKKIVRRATSAQQGCSVNPQQKEQSQSGDKKELNGSQCQIKVVTAGKSTTESARLESTTSLKPKATTGDLLPRRKVGGNDCFKKSGNTRDLNDNSYSYFNQFEKSSDVDMPKGSKRSVGEKENQIFTKKATKSAGEMFDGPLTSKVDHVAAPVFAPIAGKEPISDTVPSTTDPVLPKEDWVLCDLCGTWRLLPCGTSADHLENSEWQCSMLNWLPGMNHCSISEDETTQAVRALYQLSGPGCHPDSLIQSREYHNMAAPTPGKKNENGYDVKSSVKRLAVQDTLTVSKKRKSEDLCSANEENDMRKGGIGRNLGSDLCNDFPVEKNEKECRAYSSSNDSISNQKDRVPAVMKKPRDRGNTCYNGSDVDMGNSSNMIGKKRKAEVHSSSGRGFRDYREETNKGVENSGLTVKTISGSSNDFPIGKDGQKRQPYPSSTGVKSDQKPNVSCLINNPKDLFEVSSNGQAKKTENIDNAKVVPRRRKEEGKVISFPDKLKATKDCKGKLSSGLSDDLSVEYSSSNESKSDQDRVSAPVKKSNCRIKILFKGRNDNLKALEEKNNVEVTPSSSVCSIQESKQGTSEAVTGKTISEPKILPASGKPKLQKQFDTGNKQNGASHCSTEHNMKNETVTRAEKDFPSQLTANKVIKEGNDLKDKADRLKVFGSDLESADLSFQAALKFFRGAFLLESCGNEIAKSRDTTHSIYMYRKTAELCRSVAHEYEKFKEIAATSLAYKCMEVAYMRIVYSRNSRISQDRHALQMGLPDTRLGESPSSSISDVDNLTTRAKGDLTIVAGNVPNYERLLKNEEDVGFVMEALQKYQQTFAACKEESKYAEKLQFVQKVIEFGFQDIEGLIRLVQLAIDAIGR